jgi:hypothetical protein
MLGEVYGCVDNLVMSFELGILSFLFNVVCQGRCLFKEGREEKNNI